MKIFVGFDHRGFAHKAELISNLKKQGYDVVEDGAEQLNPDDDYPVFARRVTADMLASNDVDARGILICGSGQGMCIAANRFKGIRAALGYDHESVRSARNDDDVNVLCLATRILEGPDGYAIIDTFLKTPFAEAVRYKRRIQEMDNF